MLLVVVTCPLQTEDFVDIFIKCTWQFCCLYVQTINIQCEQFSSLLLSCAVPKLLDLLHRAMHTHRLPGALADLLESPVKMCHERIGRPWGP